MGAQKGWQNFRVTELNSVYSKSFLPENRVSFEAVVSAKEISPLRHKSLIKKLDIPEEKVPKINSFVFGNLQATFVLQKTREKVAVIKCKFIGWGFSRKEIGVGV